MELDALALKHGTDKSSEYHDYCGIYESYSKELKNSNIALIELGVGGYDYIDRGGESLRMWFEYFPHAKLIGLDVFPKKGIINNRTEFWEGSQTDKHLLKTILSRNADAEKRIVIDDASHNNELTVETFRIIFPLLKSGDLYFIEDVHVSYWEDEEYKGNKVPGAKNTTMWFFTTLTHQLNDEHLEPEYRNEYAYKIEFIHFYKELIVIKKK
jgi:hypothetical protein